MNTIGIVAQDLPDGKFGINANYLEFASEFGIPQLILPIDYNFFDEVYKIDALILPGGADVNPARYKEINYGIGSSNPYLEYFDTNILPDLIGKIPVFGICRGLQTLNVHFGGTLKNLYGHPYSISEQHEAHKITYMVKNKETTLGVNSFHHQAISKIAEELKVAAVSEKDNVIEAVFNFDLKIFAVQWHPERLWDEYSIEKFNQILR